MKDSSDIRKDTDGMIDDIHIRMENGIVQSVAAFREEQLIVEAVRELDGGMLLNVTEKCDSTYMDDMYFFLGRIFNFVDDYNENQVSESQGA